MADLIVRFWNRLRGSSLPWRDRLALVGIFVVALLLRLSAWGDFITPDELTWVFRSSHFLDALIHREWAATAQSGHPGVTTMWLGALGILLHRLLDPSVAAHLDWLSKLAWWSPHNTAALKHLAPFLPSARLPVVALTSLGVVAVYLLARRLLGRSIALVAALLMALDPFLVGHSALLHLDALLSTFMFLAVLSLLLALTPTPRPGGHSPPRGEGEGHPLRWAALSGLLTGLALLTKSPAVFLLPFATLTAILSYLFHHLWPLTNTRQPPATTQHATRNTHSILSIIISVIILLSVAVLSSAVLYPALWAQPIPTLRATFGMAGRHLHTTIWPVFFRGRATYDPGPGFYPVVLVYRLTPVVGVGVLLALALALTSTPRPGGHPPSPLPRVGKGGGGGGGGRLTLLTLLLYVVLYTVFITTARKKLDRYLLPVFPPLALVAAIGWVNAACRLKKIVGQIGNLSYNALRALCGFILVLVVLLQAVCALPHRPYYLAAFNPLLGGARGAVQVLPVGWGEGLEQAAHYLSEHPAPGPYPLTLSPSPLLPPPASGRGEEVRGRGEGLTVAVSNRPAFAPHFRGESLPLERASLAQADYAIIYISDAQLNPALTEALAAQGELIYTVRVAGLDYVQVYALPDPHQQAAYLEAHARPDDVIVCDVPAALGHLYHGDAPLHALPGSADPAEVARQLSAWAAGRHRLWYVACPTASPLLQQTLRRQLAAGATLVFTATVGTLSPVQVSLYDLPPDPAFSPGPETAVNFGGQLLLTAGGFFPPEAAWPEQARLRLRWRAVQPPAADYHVFAHLLDSEGHRWATGGTPLVNDYTFPTSAWVDEAAHPWAEVEVLLSLPAGIPPGEYHAEVGLYEATTGRRLSYRDPAGRPVGTAYPLSVTITVHSPRTPPALADLNIAHPLTHTWPAGLRLLGYDHPSTAAPGETLPVTLFWEKAIPSPSTSVPPAEPSLRFSLRTADGSAPVQAVYPLSPYPFPRWQPGERLRVFYDLSIPAQTPAGVYTLTVAYGANGEWRMANDEMEGGTIRRFADSQIHNEITLGQVEVQARSRRFTLPEDIQFPVDYRLGEHIRLVGYDVGATTVRPGEQVSCTLYWQAEGTPDIGYTVFVHILDPVSRVRGQRDAPPQNGAAPTTSWLPGQVIVDPYVFSVDADAPPGEYRLEVGMYDPATGQRLPIYDATGNRLPDDRVLLEPVIVVGEGEQP